MKHKYLNGFLLILLLLCFYQFHIIYGEAKDKAIYDLNQRQIIHARQAQRGIEDFFDHTVRFLGKLSESKHVIDLDEIGKRELDLAFRIHPGEITVIARVDAAGRIAYTTPYVEGVVGKDISDQPQVRRLLEDRKVTVSDVFKAVDGYRAIALHVPVFNEGSFEGSLGVLIDFKSLSKRFLEVIRLGETGYAWITSKEGVELYCPVPGHTGNSVFENCRDFPSILSMAKEMVKGARGFTAYTFDMIGEEKIETVKKHAVYLPIRVVDSYWSIVVASSEEEVLATLVSFKNKLALVFALLLLGSGFFSYYGIKSWMIVKEEKERKKAEESLRRNREMLARTEKIAHIGSWEWDVEADEMAWSEELFRIFRLEPGERAPSWADHPTLYHSDDMARLREAVEIALEEAVPYEMELRALRKDGETRICLAQGYPEMDSDGLVARLYGSLQDITEIKLLECSLEKERAQLLTIFNGIHAIVDVLDPVTYELLYANEYTKKIFGEDIVGKPCYRVFHNSDSPCEFCNNDIVLRQKGVPLRWEYRSEKVDKHFFATNIIIDWPDGRDVKFELSIDITERKRAEQEKDTLLRRYKQKAVEMEAMFKGAELLLEDEEFETTVRKIFGMCRDLTGASCGFVALAKGEGAQCELLFSETAGAPYDTNSETPLPLEELLDAVREIGETFYENDFSNSDWAKYMPTGPEKLENALFAPLEDTGRTVGLVVLGGKEGGFSVEDTKIVSALGELAVVSRRQNITKKALRESEKRLRQTEKLESIGNLAGGIAHDFNNILASIIGYTELALDDLEQGSVLENHLSEVYIAGKRAKELVRQILTFARKVDTEFKPVQVDVVAKEVLKLIRSTIPANIEIKSDIQSKALVLGDVTQIHQLFMNLCTNGAQSMESEGGEMHVRMSEVYLDETFAEKYKDLVPGNYLEIRISDTGTGISSEHIDHIFEPYFTTKDKGKGTGMGLPTVHGIVKAYNGEIVVESELGKGTEFTIYLPVVEKSADAENYFPNELPRGEERVLIVDDEIPVARMASMTLDRLGYETRMCTSSTEALVLFRTKPDDFDLVMTDMAMPSMAGDKLACEMMKTRPDLPVVLCTGYSSKISEETALELGFKAFLMKPLAKRALAETVRRVLDEASGEPGRRP